jgi:uncharacterized membrane protein
MVRNIKQEHKEGLSTLEKVAVKITNGVGTMYCAIAFAILAFISLPQAISGGAYTTVSWISQTFLQLVLLSIIMVGQKLQDKHAGLRDEADYETDVKAEKDIEEVSKKLDKILEKLK